MFPTATEYIIYFYKDARDIIKSKLHNADFVRDRTEGFDNFLK